MSETFDLRIESIAAGGDGVGRHDGIVVFVPRAAPGDVVRVEAERRDRLMRGRIVEMLEPSPQRVDPPCQHYVRDRCGGCQVQHLDYERQLEAKAGIIRDSLTRIGATRVDTPEVEASDAPWRYRSKLTLTMRVRRGHWHAGLRRFDAPDEVFDLHDCPITDERVLLAWKLVLQQERRLPRATELRAAVRLLPEAFAFTLEGGHDWRDSRTFFDAIPSLGELWWIPEGQGRRLMHSRIAAGYAGASFTQVNAGVAARLQAWVIGLARAVRPRTVVDAYAGTGDTAVALAADGTRVTAIEIDRDAARICASRLPEGSHAIARPVEVELARVLPADVVILNPPRAGLDARVARILETQEPAPKSVVYVSCNPATLARDIRRMGSYRIQSLRGFDMFPQTAHVETVCELVPAA